MTDPGHFIQYRSALGRQFTALFEPYSGMDFSTRCFVFPAQSSAHPSMFRREYQEFDEFRELFARADEFAAAHGICPVSWYITSPDRIPAQHLPAARTLSLFAAQYAMFRRLENQGIVPTIVTGHSFGEFAAVAAAGSVGFDEMLLVVLARERSCPEPHKLGWLLSLAAPFTALSKLLVSSTYEFAATNSPRQTLIGIPGLAETETIEKQLKAKSIAFHRLEHVPHPYHTTYMEECAIRFTAELSAMSLNISPPRYPLYSSVLHCRVDSQNFKPELIFSALARQITESIDFIAQIESIHRDGVYGFLEVGPGSVFSKLAADILKGRSYSIIPVTPWLSQEPAVIKEYDIKDHRMVHRIIGIISRLTGYELQKIQVRKRLQDDLGIDSIKKAEILFTVLEEEDVQDAAAIITSEIRTVYDLSEAVAKAKYAKKLIEPSLQAEPDFRRFRAVEEEQRLSSIASRQGPAFDRVITLSVTSLLDDPERNLDNAAGQITDAESLMIILCFDGEDLVTPLEESAGFLDAVKAFFTRFTMPFYLVAAARKDSLLFSGASSFFKSQRKELGYFHFVSVIAEGDGDISALAGHAASELYYRDMRYSEGRRYVRTMKPDILRASDEERQRFNGSVIAAIGGAKGTSFSLLSRLVKEFSVTIALIGRSRPDVSPVTEHIDLLRKGKGTVEYHQCDASSYEELQSLLQRICANHDRIDYIIDGAGFQVSAPFSSRSGEEIRKELASKIAAAENVLRVAEQLSVKKTVCFSSIVAWAGNEGQAVYAFSNGALNYLAETSPTPALSIMWPPWKGVGMMDDAVLVQKMEGMGISLLDEERAYALFRDDLIREASRGAVLYHDSSNTPLYWNPLTPLREYQSLLGTFMYHRDISFQLDITPVTHTFLHDHSLKESLYLSFSYVTALLLFQSFMLAGRMGICRNLRLFNPISVGAGAVVACHYRTGGEKCFSVTINSMRHGHHVVLAHGAGVIDFVETDLSAEISCTFPQCFNEYLQSLRKLNPPQIYGRQGLFHGPAYQVLHDLYTDGEGCQVASLPPSSPVFTGHCTFDRLVAVLEASVQLVAFRSYHERQVYSLPEAIESLHVDDRCDLTEHVYVKLVSMSYQEESITADAVVISLSGIPIVSLKGLALRVLKSNPDE
ncbi:MAG: SDR family NAD(P)-dependent oxidoreductase [Candidatus Xenobiia bacterium LiM19]